MGEVMKYKVRIEVSANPNASGQPNEEAKAVEASGENLAVVLLHAHLMLRDYTNWRLILDILAWGLYSDDIPKAIEEQVAVFLENCDSPIPCRELIAQAVEDWKDRTVGGESIHPVEHDRI